MISEREGARLSDCDDGADVVLVVVEPVLEVVVLMGTEVDAAGPDAA